MYTIEDLGVNSGYEVLVSTASIGITSSLILPTSGSYKGIMAKAVLINNESHSIRIKMNGDAASATVGMLLPAGTFYTITNVTNIKQFRCMDCSGAASVRVLIFH